MEYQLTELEELEGIYCELHKDVHGVKARWYKAASVEQARKDLDALQAQGEIIWALEKQERDEAALRVESRITELKLMGAKTRETAIRWLHESCGTDGDDEFLCYHLGLDYGYFKKVA